MATGPDAWDDVTLSRLTDTPLRWLTRMLNGIENGMDWPKTYHESARHLHTKGKQSQPRPPGLQSAPHHVADLQEMGHYEIETP